MTSTVSFRSLQCPLTLRNQYEAHNQTADAKDAFDAFRNRLDVANPMEAQVQVLKRRLAGSTVPGGGTVLDMLETELPPIIEMDNYYEALATPEPIPVRPPEFDHGDQVDSDTDDFDEASDESYPEDQEFGGFDGWN